MDHIGFKKVFTLGVSYTLEKARGQKNACLLYTSDAADEDSPV